MGTAVFPTLPNLAWSVFKRPRFSTQNARTASGKSIRTSYWSYPEWSYELSYEILGDDESNAYQTMLGFFLARRGSFDNFNFTDPDDNAVTGQTFGIGNGTTTSWQLARTYAGYVEPIFRPNGAPLIYRAGTLQTTGVTVSSEGLVTFNTAPTAGQALTWTGSFYHRLYFQEDVADFEQFLYKFWRLRRVTLVTEK